MEYGILGGSGIRASRVTFGCEALGGTDWGEVDAKVVARAVGEAWDAGITAFDVADVYGLGAAEERLAGALGPRRRDAVLVTKFGVSWKGGGPGERAAISSDASPGYLRRALESSLRRLRVDCIPVYLLHRPDPQTPLEETLEALDRCVEEGKVRCYGLSNFSAEKVGKAWGRHGFAVLENQFSLVDRSSRGLTAEAGRRGVGVLVYGTLAHGFLTGKYSPLSRFSTTDRRHRQELFSERGWRRYGGLLEALRLVAERVGRPCAQVAMRWALSADGVTSVIVGAKVPEQVQDMVAAVSCPLTAEDWGFLEGALEPKSGDGGAFRDPARQGPSL